MTTTVLQSDVLGTPHPPQLGEWRLRRLSNVEQLRAAATAWDDLWQRSAATAPAFRAEPLAAWLEAFAADARLVCWVVEDSTGRMLAALPLIERRCCGLLHLELPGNAWSRAGELLIDRETEVDTLLPALWKAIAHWPVAYVQLPGIDLHAPHWRQFLTTVETAGCFEFRSAPGEVGVVDIEHDAAAYEAARSKNLRKQMRQIVRRLERDGGASLEIHDRVTPGEVEPLLRRGFEIEDHSWKGEAGTSVLRSPEAWAFYVRQAQALAAAGHLHLVFLMYRGQTLAFEYGWDAKGVYFSPKVGYDAAFAEFCPGQLLRWLLIAHFQADPQRRAFDFAGPLAPATRRWITRSYPVATVRIVPAGLRSFVARPLVQTRLWLRSQRAQPASQHAEAGDEDALAGG